MSLRVTINVVVVEAVSQSVVAHRAEIRSVAMIRQRASPDSSDNCETVPDPNGIKISQEGRPKQFITIVILTCYQIIILIALLTTPAPT
jgi:hypothetical protein